MSTTEIEFVKTDEIPVDEIFNCNTKYEEEIVESETTIINDGANCDGEKILSLDMNHDNGIKCGEILIANKTSSSYAFICSFCNEMFKNIEELLNHIKLIHSQNDNMNDNNISFIGCNDHKKDDNNLLNENEILMTNNLNDDINGVDDVNNNDDDDNFMEYIELRRNTKSNSNSSKNNLMNYENEFNLNTVQHILDKILTDDENDNNHDDDENKKEKEKNDEYLFVSSCNLEKNEIKNCNNIELNNSEEEKLICNVCSKKFQSKKIYEKHRNLHLEKSDPFFSINNKITNDFINEINTNINLQDPVHEENGQFLTENIQDNKNSTTVIVIDPLVCKYCNHRFKERSKRLIHERIHTGEKPFKCDSCDKRFRTKRLLQNHLMIHKGERPHKCPYCNSAFTHKMNLVVHIRVHLGDKRFECELCGKRFVRNIERKIHQRTHTGEKPYQCDYCGRCFSTCSKLTEHRKRHTNTKPYKCQICDKRFYSKGLMTNHAVVHSNERPFICDICDATFPRKRALQSHRKIHSNIKEYVCKICSKAFAQNAGLYCHMKVHGTRTKKTVLE